jgi:flagellar biogenesis protein FliO
MIRRTLVVVALLAGLPTTSVVAQSPYDAPPRGESPTPGFLPSVAPSAAPLIPPTEPAAPQPVQQAVALSPPDARTPTKLALPAAPDGKTPRTSGGGSGFASILGALVVVVGLFLAVAALLRRGMPKQARLLPIEAVEILGRLPLPGRQQGHLIRVGNKIALVSFSTGTAESLVEITDPVEVDRLAGLCRQHDPHSATTSFRGVVEQFFRDKPTAPRNAAATAEDDDA